MPALEYTTVKEFMQDAVPTSVFEDVRREIEQEQNRPITTSQAYRNAGIDGEAWSELGHQVFGAEVKIQPK